MRFIVLSKPIVRRRWLRNLVEKVEAKYPTLREKGTLKEFSVVGPKQSGKVREKGA